METLSIEKQTYLVRENKILSILVLLETLYIIAPIVEAMLLIVKAML